MQGYMFSFRFSVLHVSSTKGQLMLRVSSGASGSILCGLTLANCQFLHHAEFVDRSC